MNSLLVKKLLVAFIVGFGGVIVPGVLKVLDDVQNGVATDFTHAFWLSMVAGAFAAGIRALLAISPINLVPSDKEHSLIGK